MQSFQGKLPKVIYTFRVKSGKRIRKFLEDHGCNLYYVRSGDPSIITVYCGGCYDYDIGSELSHINTTPKEFKRIVREALGESKMKLTEKNIGQRVQLKRDDMLGFKVGDVGTIKAVDGLMYAVHFDIARNGWERDALGIPDLHGLYVYPEDLCKVKGESK